VRSLHYFVLFSGGLLTSNCKTTQSNPQATDESQLESVGDNQLRLPELTVKIVDKNDKPIPNANLEFATTVYRFRFDPPPQYGHEVIPGNYEDVDATGTLGVTDKDGIIVIKPVNLSWTKKGKVSHFDIYANTASENCPRNSKEKSFSYDLGSLSSSSGQNRLADRCYFVYSKNGFRQDQSDMEFVGSAINPQGSSFICKSDLSIDDIKAMRQRALGDCN
jgi:hypothetical protein